MGDAPEKIFADRGLRGGLLYREQKMPDTIAEYTRSDLVAELTAENERLKQEREVLVSTSKLSLANLVAAHSLLSRSPKSAAPSDKMFDQMLSDYQSAIDKVRADLKAAMEAQK